MNSGYPTDLETLLPLLREEIAESVNLAPEYVVITLNDEWYIPDAVSDRYVLITGFSGSLPPSPFDGGGGIWDGDPTGANFDHTVFTVVMGNRLDTDLAGHDVNRLCDTSFGSMKESRKLKRSLFNWWPVASSGQAMLVEMPRVTSWSIVTRQYKDAAGWSRVELKMGILYVQSLEAES